MEWVNAQERLPKERKEVLCRVQSVMRGAPDALVVGYLRYAAGDKDSPMFVVPGLGGTVLEWCDCLPEKFTYPKMD